MEIINYKNGSANGGIIINGKDQYIAVTEYSNKNSNPCGVLKSSWKATGTKK